MILIRTFILRSCAKAWGVTVADIFGKDRDYAKTHARSAAALLLKETFNVDDSKLGRLLGDKDNAMARAAVQRAKELAGYDAVFADKLLRVRTALTTLEPVEPIVIKKRPKLSNQLWEEERNFRKGLAQAEQRLLAAVQAAHPERLQMQEAAE